MSKISETLQILKQEMKLLFRFTRDLFFDDGAGLSQDEKKIIADTRQSELHRVVSHYNRFSSPMYALGSLLVWLFGHEEIKALPALWLLSFSLESAFWLIFYGYVPKHHRSLVISARGSYLAFMTIVITAALIDIMFKNTSLSIEYIAMCGVLLGIIGWIIAAGAAFYGRMAVVFLSMLAASVLTETIALRSTNLTGLFLMVLVPNCILGGYFLLDRQLRQRAALLDFKTQQLSIQNERLKRQALETELTAARTIQESVQEPLGIKVTSSFDFEFLHEPFGILGGDWVAHRELKDGRQIVVVIDVTGKGIPAAMVVQAVQALWVASLAKVEFNAAEWIDTVNNTLGVLGGEKSHTMSLALLELGETTLKYFSAGHVPMFMVKDVGAGSIVETIHGRGNILGIEKNVAIKCVDMKLPDSPFVLLVGSDGVFDWRTRKQPNKTVYDLLQAVLVDGKQALARHPVEDDKILVLIKSKPAAGKLGKKAA